MIEQHLQIIQINDGGKWYNLPCYDVPDSLENGAVVQVLDDPTLPCFQAAWKASDTRAATLFRLNDEDAGRPFWVELSNTPTLAAGRMMTLMMILTPAAV
jgi:hypothetical protein